MNQQLNTRREQADALKSEIAELKATLAATKEKHAMAETRREESAATATAS